MMFNTTPPCVFFEPSNMDPYGTTCSMAMPTPPGIAIAVALFGTVESFWPTHPSVHWQISQYHTISLFVYSLNSLQEMCRSNSPYAVISHWFVDSTSIFSKHRHQNLKVPQ
jgi:hypothetical protein